MRCGGGPQEVMLFLEASELVLPSKALLVCCFADQRTLARISIITIALPNGGSRTGVRVRSLFVGPCATCSAMLATS